MFPLLFPLLTFGIPNKMPSKISFYLKEPTAKSETLLLAFVYLTRKHKFKVSTGKKLHPDDWNSKKQVVRASHPQANSLNELLKKIRADYENICLDAEVHGRQVTKEYLQLNSRFTDNTEPSPLFFEVYDAFVNSKRTHCAKASIEKYGVIKGHLESFATKCKYQLSFQTIDFNFYERFNEYLLFEKGMFNSTAAKTLKFVKTFLNYAFDNGYHTNLNFKKFKALKDNAEEIIALSVEELQQIEKLENLPPYLDKTRILFLILCYTGVRYSDLKNINGNAIKDGMLNITTQKTKDVLKIPVHTRLSNLLEKLTKEKVIEFGEISNQKMNFYLKEIGKKAKLNEKCVKVRYKGGQAYETVKEKWELLTTHTGRRTFTTLSLFLGMDSESVKKITGHKNDATFKKYVRYSDQQLKQKIKVWE